ncbi:MAG: S41 family peptidase [Bryobacteraceae bacterium]
MIWPLLLFLVPAAFAAEQTDLDLDKQVKQFVDVFALVEREAAEPIDYDKAFYEGAIPGLLRRLDPHSVFLESQQFEQLKQLQTSTSKGFGSVVSVLPGRVIVLQALPGAPSAKAGIAPGDEILAINGYQIDRLEMEQLIALLSQSRQQPARLNVRRPGNARLMEFVLVPEEMQSPSVDRAFLIQPGIAYLRVTSFDEKTGTQVREGIEKLGGQSLKGLVLDMRNNPGGVLPAALETASLFLNAGQRLLSVGGRRVPEQEKKAPDGNKPYTFPVAVLMNGKSASASEIVAGAMQDHDRGVVVGEPSFGKGLVESVYPLSFNHGLALTTALYYTPSGRSIQRPLGKEFALSETSAKNDREFKTDAGRTVRGGGGIQPDHLVYPESQTRLRVVLDATGMFPSFATEYLNRNKITEKFEVSAAVLDEFQVFLSQRNIRPAVAEWSGERDFLHDRLKTEIFNQAFGVEKGDQIEIPRDPVVRKALELIAQ